MSLGGPLERHWRLLTAAFALLVLGGLALIAFGPARGLREDVGLQQEDVGALRELIEEQTALLERQVEVADETLVELRGQRDTLGQVVGLLKRSIEIQRQILDASRDSATGQTAVQLAQQLLELSRQILEQVAEINEKTADQTPPSPTPT